MRHKALDEQKSTIRSRTEEGVSPHTMPHTPGDRRIHDRPQDGVCSQLLQRSPAVLSTHSSTRSTGCTPDLHPMPSSLRPGGRPQVQAPCPPSRQIRHRHTPSSGRPLAPVLVTAPPARVCQEGGPLQILHRTHSQPPLSSSVPRTAAPTVRTPHRHPQGVCARPRTVLALPRARQHARRSA